MKRQCHLPVLVVLIWAATVPAAEEPPLPEKQFQETLRSLKAERSAAGKLRHAKTVFPGHWLSSRQVKAIAARLADDDARLEFALAAYPRTVDPENFYDVYDAFTTFSKVMRLHDRIQSARHRGPPPAVAAPQPMTDQDLKQILQALRRESLESNRSRLARQILGSSQANFLARQIKDILGCFDFESTKLEVAKFAYDYTLDREKYFLVNEAFTFSSSKDELSRYLESRTPSPPPAIRGSGRVRPCCSRR